MKRFITPLITAFIFFTPVLFTPVSGHAAPDYYRLDGPHTQVRFSVDNLGLIESSGQFTDYRGGFTFDAAHPGRSTVDVVIMTRSVDMGDGLWNAALKAPSYFNVDEYPTMTFRSTDFRMTGRDTADVTGDLTLLGVTRPVTFHMRLKGADGRSVARLSGDGAIDRSDFGMTAGLPLVSDRVTIHLDVQGDRVVASDNGIYDQ